MSFTQSKLDFRLSRDNELRVLDANILALASLPEDLILEIASFLEHRSDILHLGVSVSSGDDSHIQPTHDGVHPSRPGYFQMLHPPYTALSN
jgi:hypothetical protein